jgi:acid phosphatase
VRITPRKRRLIAAGAVLAVSGATAAVQSTSWANEGRPGAMKIDHIVVIYEENHSFDNLFGGWEDVHGLSRAASSGHVTQVADDGSVLPCLPQNDVNLVGVQAGGTPCTIVGADGRTYTSTFANAPFTIDSYIKPDDTTCPPPGVFAANGVLNGQGLPGGCTRDLVHRYYTEQYQIDGGRQDRYVAGSDAIGLSMGTYDTRALPIYRYLHGPDAPSYAIADNFFQSAFGGSFLNHQWLIAAGTPTWPGAVADGGANDLHSVLPADGNPQSTPLHAAPGARDAALTQAAGPGGGCAVPAGAATPPAGTVCGDYAINTIQPTYQPFSPGTADSRKLPPQTGPTIGDRLSARGVDWAWYSGGWDNAAGITDGPGWTSTIPGACDPATTAAGATYPYCPDKTFQYHHQAFNYYANYAPGTAARAAHLRDEVEFEAAAEAGTLKPVSFVKPLGIENEHPGYASEHNGSDHLVDLLTAIENGPDADSTMVIVTYDEFGGQWDHVSPPTAPGISDQWGPGTRIPALVISPALSRRFAVDSTEHDTTSILATIERRFNLQPLGSRDAAVADLWPLMHPGSCTGHSNCAGG